MTRATAKQRVLILGGSSEARILAARLTDLGLPVVSSLAGRLESPRMPAGEARVGGFGGPQALAAWISEQQIGAVIDATHPFAARIGTAAVAACEQAGVPLLRLERPSSREQPGDRWHRVASLEAAASMLPTLGRRALLAIGRQGVGAFVQVTSVWFLVRCIEAPTGPLPPQHELLLTRGPFALPDELSLFGRHAIDVVVTKDSGGASTDAKLGAARHLGLPVVMIERPVRPVAPASVPDVDAAVAWVRALLDSPGRGNHVADSDSEATCNR